MNSKRIFLGIPVNAEIKEKVTEIQQELQQIEGGWKIVQPNNLHLTLKFLGEVKEEKIEKIKEKIASLNLGKPFQVKVKTIGVFPNEDYITVIWFGLEDKEQIFYLHKQIDFALSKLFPIEKDFLAHVTLARVKFIKDKPKFKQFLIKHKNIDLGEMTINKVILYESKLEKEGPVYSILEEFELK
ncbi:MAG: RNA 2',3'-cyclic phosphodiesterase [Candidatus Woesearchaeota archaeon]